MATYDEIRQMIISTLTGRPAGTEIQPDKQEEYELNMLDFIREVEATTTSAFAGIADNATTPLQPENARVNYLSAVSNGETITFTNFRNSNGNPISVTAGSNEVRFILLLWNGSAWSVQTMRLVMSNNTYNSYSLSVRKTYASVVAMNNDRYSPIGNNGEPITVGQIVSVEGVGLYSYTGNGWTKQQTFESMMSRVFDCGRADSVYGGARNIDCGRAS